MRICLCLSVYQEELSEKDLIFIFSLFFFILKKSQQMILKIFYFICVVQGVYYDFIVYFLVVFSIMY